MSGLTVRRLCVIASLIAAGILASCAHDEGRSTTNVPSSITEACSSLDLPSTAPTKAEAEGARDAALAQMSPKYDVVDSALSQCGDGFVVTIGVRSGDVSESDKAFILDGVGVILVSRRGVYNPF